MSVKSLDQFYRNGQIRFYRLYYYFYCGHVWLINLVYHTLYYLYIVL